MTPVGITFNDEKHSFTDFHLRLLRVNIGLPDVKKTQVDIPGADGYADMTDYFGTRYKNRKITAECDVEDRGHANWASAVSSISNYLHGKRTKVIFDFDPGYYYLGRGMVETEKNNRVYSGITLFFDCEPYKYELTASDEDWPWDPFDFKNGIIRGYKNLVVNGSRDLAVYGSPMETTPRIICSAAMQVIFDGKIYSLSAGENYITDILIKDGPHALTFKGNGTVTIVYRGGSL